ncbi:MAG: prephenate dehydrogenase/arogenate dehydrogenase family protein [Candidatus Methylacidiphilales bacterium]|nr:prephenate dehydrogenase/arogenate dehydrogenase family protein [Candidatus Methylacidiphilales bacterium]
MNRTVAIFGPGLLGGSILMALRAREPSTRLHTWARRPEALAPVREQQLADLADTDPVRVAAGADLVVLCTPVGAMPDLVRQILPAMDHATVLTDVGSVKAPVHLRLAPMTRDRCAWLGSHPMAGSEQSGLSAARASLFDGSLTILTPDDDTPARALTALRAFWESLGSRTITCSPQEHDRRVAAISHLPHLLAALLVHAADAGAREFAGPGFRDVTRIAAGPPEMWTEILLENRTAVLEALASLEASSRQARSALEAGDAATLTDLLHKACQVRRSLS